MLNCKEKQLLITLGTLVKANLTRLHYGPINFKSIQRDFKDWNNLTATGAGKELEVIVCYE